MSPDTTVTSANKLNCTANDIRLSGVAIDPDTQKPMVFPESCIEGETFTLTATFLTDVTANARYDAGFFFRTDGGDNARGDGTTASGTCSVSSLDNPPAVPGLALDGDTCGDLNSGQYLSTFTIPNVLCAGVEDPDDPTKKILKLPNCTSWHSNQGTECNTETPYDLDPDTKSKCVCDDDFTVPVIVEQANLTVTKTAAPTSVSEEGADVTYSVQVVSDAQFVNVTITTLTDDIYGDIGIPGCDESGPPSPCNSAIKENSCDDLVGDVLTPASNTASCSFKAFVSGDKGDVITDTVEVCGTQSNTGAKVCADDVADVTITDTPALPALSKTALSAGCRVDAYYQVVVSNDSIVNDVLTVNSLTDDQFGNLTVGLGASAVNNQVVSTDCVTGGTIAKGANYSCNFTGRIISSTCAIDHTNTATAGVTDDDGESYSPSNSATVKVNTTFP